MTPRNDASILRMVPQRWGNKISITALVLAMDEQKRVYSEQKVS